MFSTECLTEKHNNATIILLIDTVRGFPTRPSKPLNFKKAWIHIFRQIFSSERVPSFTGWRLHTVCHWENVHMAKTRIKPCVQQKSSDSSVKLTSVQNNMVMTASSESTWPSGSELWLADQQHKTTLRETMAALPQRNWRRLVKKPSVTSVRMYPSDCSNISRSALWKDASVWKASWTSPALEGGFNINQMQRKIYGGGGRFWKENRLGLLDLTLRGRGLKHTHTHTSHSSSNSPIAQFQLWCRCVF